MRIVNATNRAAVGELLSPRRVRDVETDRRVAEIVADVREHGDEALLRYARTFDGLTGQPEISRKEMTAAARTVPAPETRWLTPARPEQRMSRARFLPRIFYPLPAANMVAIVFIGKWRWRRSSVSGRKPYFW